MRATTRALCLLGGLLLALPGGTQAAVYGARVRWQASADPAIAGYRVWVRPVNGTAGAPREAGLPAVDNGTLSFVVDALDVRTDYAVSVTAYSGAGTDSAHSNEVQVGYAQVAPLIDSDGDGLRDATEDRNLNRIVDAGETDPTRADTDGDGIGDPADRCGGTGAGAAVNAQGCSCAQVTCDDGNACTTDTCDPERGCSHTVASDGRPCDDGLFCTVGETCQAGACTPGRPNCADATGACQTGNCDEAGDRCFTSPRADGTPCGDGNVCNGSETCQAGRCAASQPLDCDDHNPCTLDTCDAAGGCAHAPAADGTSCDDGSFCNGTEGCQAGACIATAPPVCDDGNSCTTDTCDDAQKRCSHGSVAGCCAVDADCADQDACTTNERCAEGRCVSDPVVCPDAGACGESTCDPQRGCTEVSRPEGGACEDGDPCTQGERCSLGVCAAPTTQADTTPGGELQVTRFVLRPLGRRGQLMTAEGVFTSPWASDAAETGLTTQLMSPDGEVLYSVTVPPGTLHPRQWRNRLVYTGTGDSAETVGLRRLVLDNTAGGARLTIRAVVPRAIGKGVAQGARGATSTGTKAFSWAVWVGGSCVRDPAVSCARAGRGKRCG